MIARRIMQKVEGPNVFVLRAVAESMLAGMDDLALGVVAEGIGIPPIVNRAVFIRNLGRLGRKKLSKVLAGSVALDQFSDAHKSLRRHYGITSKTRKAAVQ